MGNLKALPQFYFTKTNVFIEEVQLTVFKEEPSYGKQLVLDGYVLNSSAGIPSMASEFFTPGQPSQKEDRNVPVLGWH